MAVIRLGRSKTVHFGGNVKIRKCNNAIITQRGRTAADNGKIVKLSNCQISRVRLPALRQILLIFKILIKKLNYIALWFGMNRMVRKMNLVNKHSWLSSAWEGRRQFTLGEM